jgi:hypothetical protein
MLIALLMSRCSNLTFQVGMGSTLNKISIESKIIKFGVRSKKL